MTTPQPPPEAVLIAEMRKRPPHQSIRQAATAAGISETRWRQIENGVRHFRGQAWQEPPGPAGTVARMARAVAVTPQQLIAAGRPDAAAELAALLLVGAPYLTRSQRAALERAAGRGEDEGG